MTDTEKDLSEKSSETTQLSSNPINHSNIIAALESKLNTMVGTASGYIETLPPSVKRRISALKKLQFESTKIEAEFFVAVHKLECEYEARRTPLYKRRFEITSGFVEPSDAESDWVDHKSDDEEEEEGKEAVAPVPEPESGTKGISEFWLTIFKNMDLLQDMIQEHDEELLSHLIDVNVDYKEDPMGFIINFQFSPNEYFSNTVLTKEYFMKCVPSETDPFSFEGPEIYKCVGCSIDWKKGKNITLKTVKKKQKNKNASRVIMKEVKNDSFFNFFDPPSIPDDPDADIEVETQELLSTDFEIGHYIRERIVPRAVLFFTGEALEDEYDKSGSEMDEEDEEDEDDEDKEDEDEDPDYVPGKKESQQSTPECKQQ